jgi:hypothetical protein
MARKGSIGRGLVSRGEHLRINDLPSPLRSNPLVSHSRGGWRVPFDVPTALFTRTAVRSFNTFHYNKGKGRVGERVVHYDSFFFPLDRLLDWNRLYGRRGFMQYQCVLPKSESVPGLAALLACIAKAEVGSFLAVLKLLGPQGEGLLSFPMEGFTLALDFPLRRGTMALLAELDRITVAHGGRVYLAKDARVAREHFAAGYPTIPDFIEFRRERACNSRFSSTMSERLAL